MHLKYRCVVATSVDKISNICCLANVRQGKEAIAIFKLTSEKEILEVAV